MQPVNRDRGLVGITKSVKHHKTYFSFLSMGRGSQSRQKLPWRSSGAGCDCTFKSKHAKMHLSHLPSRQPLQFLHQSNLFQVPLQQNTSPESWHSSSQFQRGGCVGCCSKINQETCGNLMTWQIFLWHWFLLNILNQMPWSWILGTHINGRR